MDPASYPRTVRAARGELEATRAALLAEQATTSGLRRKAARQSEELARFHAGHERFITKQTDHVKALEKEVERLRGEAAEHRAAIRVAQDRASAFEKEAARQGKDAAQLLARAEAAESLARYLRGKASPQTTGKVVEGESRERATGDPSATAAALAAEPVGKGISGEVDYKGEYMAIGATVGACFPECETTTLDLVRLLMYENATYRIALNLPLPGAVMARVAADSEATDHE